MQYDKLIDEFTVGANTYTYIGEATPGSISSAAAWRIRRLTEISGNTVSTYVWADNTEAFTKIWNDRTTYTYDV